jgi:hypothetical protein
VGGLAVSNPDSRGVRPIEVIIRGQRCFIKVCVVAIESSKQDGTPDPVMAKSKLSGQSLPQS